MHPGSCVGGTQPSKYVIKARTVTRGGVWMQELMKAGRVYYDMCALSSCFLSRTLFPSNVDPSPTIEGTSVNLVSAWSCAHGAGSTKRELV